MRHIFCGEIVNFEAQGFHSLNTTTNWRTCAAVQQCQAFPSGNGYCRNVFIYDSRDASYELKEYGSTLWPTSCSPAQLVPMLQYLYSNCQPTAYAGSLCYPDCHFEGNNNGFDIVIGTEGDAIVTAYPAQEGTCLNHPQWQDCNENYCQEL